MSHTLLGLAGLFLGVAGGFALAKKANRWCPACGEGLTADHCRSPFRDAANGPRPTLERSTP